MITRIRTAVLLTLMTVSAAGQTPTGFDLNAYYAFLNSHQNMTSADLHAMYPAGTFRAQTPVDYVSAQYFSRLDSLYSLTKGEKTLLGQNGFAVTERVSPRSYGSEFLRIFYADVPVFVSTDAILHALHMSYDLILQTTEEQILIPRLGHLLMTMHGQVATLAQRYQSAPGMTAPLTDLDLYLTVARKQLGQAAVPWYFSNIAASANIDAQIQAGLPVKGTHPLFADSIRRVDYSQFTPRGHYTETIALQQYFRAMMWLGRMEFYLSAPRGTAESYTDAQVQRQTLAAVLMLEALHLSGSQQDLDVLESYFRFLVGESDNATPALLTGLVGELGIDRADSLLDMTRFKEFQATLLTRGWAYQRILSQMLCSGSILATDQIQPASAFLLLGQRFVIDSYVTGNVVYDRIVYHGGKVARMLPSSLDVLFALGNDGAAQLLTQELDRYPYATNLASLRYLIDSYEPEFWRGTLYNNWLQALRALNPPRDRTALPSFMQGAAWWQEKVNTQLASWAELRHDNILYAKQSYTGIPICSYPHSYVEPVPEFYRAVAGLADTAAAWFARTAPGEMPFITSYFARVAGICDTLNAIAEKELAGVTTSPDEQEFLRYMMYLGTMGCSTQMPRGWYTQLFIEPLLSTDEDLVVADVHTSPADEAGNIVGWVLHAGTGALNAGVVVADIPGTGPVAFAGPVSSYREYVTGEFKRLTDEEWEAGYARSLSIRPSFVNAYLADTLGNMRDAGVSLLTGVDSDGDDPGVPSADLLAQNYPNPFNARTLIGFRVATSGEIRLEVFDVLGRLVRTLVAEHKDPGTYTVPFDGSSLGSGAYYCRLRASGNVETRRMLLIK